MGDIGKMLATTNGGSTWTPQSSGTTNELRGTDCQSMTCRVVGVAGTILANRQVPLQPAGRGFRLSAGPVPSLGSALLSWTRGTQQIGYVIFRVAMDSGTVDVLPPDGSLLPAPAQSYQDTAALAESLYCYQLLPWGDAGALGTSDQLCLFPGTGSASGAPPSLTVRLNQSGTTSLSWTPPGGQYGYLLAAQPLPGEARWQVLPGAATNATDDTLGVATCYLLEPTAAGAPIGNSDVLCSVPGQATIAGVPAPGAALPHLTPSTLATRAAAEALRRADLPGSPRRGR